MRGSTKILRFFTANREQIAIARVVGNITASNPEIVQLIEFLSTLHDVSIKALILWINSPGGTIGAAQEIYELARSISEKKGVLVLAVLAEMATSGALYVAMGADLIFAQPGTVTGSIGAIIQVRNLAGLLEQFGVACEAIKSGNYKDALAPYKNLSIEERRILQTLIDDTHEQFVEIVVIRRKIPQETVRDFSDGRMLTGRQALALGLIDELGGMRVAIQRAIELTSISTEPTFLVMETRKSFLEQGWEEMKRKLGLDDRFNGPQIMLWNAPYSSLLALWKRTRYHL